MEKSNQDSSASNKNLINTRLENMLTTPYEKSIKTLKMVKKALMENSENNKLIEGINYVIEKIRNRSLYTFDLDEKSKEQSEVSDEVDSIIEMISQYSSSTFSRRSDRVKTMKNLVKFVLPVINKTPSSFKPGTPVLNSINTMDKKMSLFRQDYEFEDKEEIDLTKGFNLNHNFEVFSDNFNMFDFAEFIGSSAVMRDIGQMAFEFLSLTEYVNMDKVGPFFDACSSEYIDNPYHNKLHGADVLQGIAKLLLTIPLECLKLSEMDIAAILVAAAAHDIGHPGLTNNYMINSGSELALNYNDKSVLENYHASLCFRLLKQPELNIFEGLNNTCFRSVRRRIIESILSTDMAFHAKWISIIKLRLDEREIAKGENIEMLVLNNDKIFEEQQDIINFLVHSMDIGHSAKPFELSKKWTFLLMEEFWLQGDKERGEGLQISFLCDRITAEVEKSQLGFIKGFVQNTFEVMVDMFPKLSFMLENVHTNYENWSKITESKKKLEEKHVDV